MTSALTSTPGEPSTEDELVQYVYGIVMAGDRVSVATEGLDERPVEFVQYEDLAAVVSSVRADRALGNRDDLFAYYRVLDHMAGHGAVIPLRFGSLLSSSGAVVEELLAPHADEFRASLAELGGKAQFNLRARYREDAVLAEVVSENPEIARLRAETRDTPESANVAARVRLGELVARAIEIKREIDAGVLIDVLAPHAVAYHRRQGGGGIEYLLDAAFLVDRTKRDEFDAAAEELAEIMHERASLSLLGPLAPYDFVARR